MQRQTGLIFALVLTSIAPVRVLHERGGRTVRRMFRFSILYLFVLFAALIIETAV